MEEEFTLNEGGKWKAEYDYVVKHAAIAVPDEPSDSAARRDKAAKFAALGLADGAKRKRDLGYDGRTLDWFCDEAEKS